MLVFPNYAKKCASTIEKSLGPPCHDLHGYQANRTMYV